MSRPWYCFYPADYVRDTGHLTLVEHGAYRLLMDHYYASETPLPNDERRLLRLTRAKNSAERDAVRYVLAEFFRLGDEGYRHKRIDIEIARAEERTAQASAAGRAGAMKRWHGGAIAEAMADAMAETQLSQSQSQPPSKNNDPLFEEFWLAYPRKESRGPAVKAWARALEMAPAATLILAAKSYAVRRAGQDPNFTRLPATWLAQECWLDDAPQIVDADAAMRAWNGAAAPLVAEIGAAPFTAYFAAAEFSPGPPAVIRVAKPHLRALIARRFSGALTRAYGEFSLEA